MTGGATGYFSFLFLIIFLSPWSGSDLKPDLRER